MLYIYRLIERPALLRDYAALTIPGGFSYGDDIAAGRIFANQLVHHLREELERFVAAGRLVLGICNGFQILVKAGLLPGPGRAAESAAALPVTAPAEVQLPASPRPRVTITGNAHGRFEDRWIHMRVDTDRCPLLVPGELLHMPIAHGEGRVICDCDATLSDLRDEKLIALRYADAAGRTGDFPTNPNGSVDHIAGLIDRTGRILGLMPHPDRAADELQLPTRDSAATPSGRLVFSRAMAFLRRS
jgi:phosphoribosylformylglycinamidine synthase